MRDIRSIAIGGFDGMHCAHQELFKIAGEGAVVVVIESGYANLTPKREREKHTDLPLVYLELSTIRHLDAEGFVEYLKRMFPSLERVVVGYDFHFGKDRAYSYGDLQELFDGDVLVVDEFKIDGESVHSCKIREYLGSAQIQKANRFLGYRYTISTQIVKGQGIGSRDLVATFNSKCNKTTLLKDGVYATYSRLDADEIPRASITFIGRRSVTDNSYTIETHLLDYDRKRRVESIDISFVDYIRESRSYQTLKELKIAISQDIESAKEILHDERSIY